MQSPTLDQQSKTRLRLNLRVQHEIWRRTEKRTPKPFWDADPVYPKPQFFPDDEDDNESIHDIYDTDWTQLPQHEHDDSMHDIYDSDWTQPPPPVADDDDLPHLADSDTDNDDVTPEHDGSESDNTDSGTFLRRLHKPHTDSVEPGSNPSSASQTHTEAAERRANLRSTADSATVSSVRCSSDRVEIAPVQGPTSLPGGWNNPIRGVRSRLLSLPTFMEGAGPMALALLPWIAICCMAPGGSHTGANPRRGGRDPPSWNPEREHQYSYRNWSQDI